jgi:hypothetical protein
VEDESPEIEQLEFAARKHPVEATVLIDESVPPTIELVPPVVEMLLVSPPAIKLFEALLELHVNVTAFPPIMVLFSTV